MALRAQPHHRWFYYPEMTGDEVLAFKDFQLFKRDAEPAVEACFHSAFEHPDTPDNAPARQSCEHRVSVFFLRATDRR